MNRFARISLPHDGSLTLIGYADGDNVANRRLGVVNQFMDGADRLIESESPDAAASRDELAEAIDQAIAALPDDLRSALALREFEGLSYEQIAAIMECPVGTVRSRIFRAREAVDRRIGHLLDR